ncbi:MAG: hypothetical protein PUK70_08310 [Bacteroidales bacterium]|nr:hypothetical protein [Bacteroidales bacterium]MDY6000717.1 hypothetical protein [Candidatus Cryptobacteroides sp.]
MVLYYEDKQITSELKNYYTHKKSSRAVSKVNKVMEKRIPDMNLLLADFLASRIPSSGRARRIIAEAEVISER